MAIDKLQKQTNINIQEKANLIWEIATHLYDEYKPHEYGKVVLPMTVIKRFDNAFQRLLVNDQFQKDVMDIMAQELYKTLVLGKYDKLKYDIKHHIKRGENYDTTRTNIKNRKPIYY